jgi:hypothetical protein
MRWLTMEIKSRKRPDLVFCIHILKQCTCQTINYLTFQIDISYIVALIVERN